MHKVIYKWIPGKGFNKIYKIDGFNVWDFALVSDNKVAFQMRPEYIECGVTESELTVLDINTLEVEKYPCHYGYVQKWIGNRICVFSVEPSVKVPIAECFDFDTNEKKVLKYGALGKESIKDIYETDNGTVIIGSGKNIYLTKELWEFMKLEKKFADKK